MDLCEIKFKFIKYGLLVYIDGELHEEIDAFDLSDEIEPTEEEWNAVKISISEEPMIITWILPRRLIQITDHDEYHDFKKLTICAPKSVITSKEELERKVVEMGDMSKHNNFQKQIYKYLDQVPVVAINSNEILLRLIANELAVIVDGIGRLANINYELSTEEIQEEEEKENDGKNE